MAYDVIDAVGLGDLHRCVYAAVIDDQLLHRMETVDRSGQCRKGNCQGCRLVKTWDLDDQFHGLLPQKLPL